MLRRATVLASLALAALLVGAAAPAAASEPKGAAADAASIEIDGRECRLIAVPAAAPAGTGGCPGVRPGALLETPTGFCTMNFLFRDRDGTRYIATAGHCILGGEGERTWARKGPKARDTAGRVIGSFAYATLGDERDFALIRLRRATDARPRMCRFGGPTTIDRSLRRGPAALQTYGQGVLTGDLSPARSLFALSLADPRHVFATGAAAPGDSGGPVTLRRGDGALGVLVTVGVHFGDSLADSGAVGILRTGPLLERAAAKLDERLRLVQGSR